MELEQQIEIANPQHPHCATILLLDTSGSMAGDKINQLNEGLRLFLNETGGNDLARKRVDLAVVTFGNDVKLVQDFASVEAISPLTLMAGGVTPMGTALLEALRMLDRTYVVLVG